MPPPGDRFGRKKLVAMGVSLGSEVVTVRLTEDESAVSWSSVDSPTFGNVKVSCYCQGCVLRSKVMF